MTADTRRAAAHIDAATRSTSPAGDYAPDRAAAKSAARNGESASATDRLRLPRCDQCGESMQTNGHLLVDRRRALHRVQLMRQRADNRRKLGVIPPPPPDLVAWTWLHRRCRDDDLDLVGVHVRQLRDERSILVTVTRLSLEHAVWFGHTAWQAAVAQILELNPASR